MLEDARPHLLFVSWSLSLTATRPVLALLATLSSRPPTPLPRSPTHTRHPTQASSYVPQAAPPHLLALVVPSPAPSQTQALADDGSTGIGGRPRLRLPLDNGPGRRAQDRFGSGSPCPSLHQLIRSPPRPLPVQSSGSHPDETSSSAGTSLSGRSAPCRPRFLSPTVVQTPTDLTGTATMSYTRPSSLRLTCGSLRASCRAKLASCADRLTGRLTGGGLYAHRTKTDEDRTLVCIEGSPSTLAIGFYSVC